MLEFAAVIASNALVRARLARLIAVVPGVAVRYEADDIHALRFAVPPAIVLIDLHDRPGSWVSPPFWTRLPPGSRTVALCHPDDPPHLPTALRAGVRGLLTRDAVATELVVTVETVRQGGAHISAGLLGALMRDATPAPVQGPGQLGNRERETLVWVAQGLTNAQIGRQMGLSESTVNTYVKRIRAKLDAHNKADLTRRAIALGYVPYG